MWLISYLKCIKGTQILPLIAFQEHFDLSHKYFIILRRRGHWQGPLNASPVAVTLERDRFECIFPPFFSLLSPHFIQLYLLFYSKSSFNLLIIVP